DASRAQRQGEAASRILSLSGAQVEWDNGDRVAEGSHELSGPAALDDAVALIELAGYPHVLAREAYALLELTGAADAMALVARSERGLRCVAARGWTEAQALDAARDPGDRLHVVCGSHRDETWEIVARL